MAEFRVWAPSRKRLDVVVGGKVFPMEVEDGGWWAADVSQINEAADYLFRLDAEKTCPDPRSRFQPNGVHAPSRMLRSNQQFH